MTATPAEAAEAAQATDGEAPALVPARSSTRAPFAAPMAGFALAAVAVALYLGLTKLLGGSPTCAVLAGCDTVSSSEYSQVMGVPVGLLGAGASALTLTGVLGWWWRGDRRALVGAYALGLASLPILAWLTWLELFVIGALCIWCVAYALLVIAGWATAGVALVRRPDPRA